MKTLVQRTAVRRTAWAALCAAAIACAAVPATAAVDDDARAGYYQRALDMIDKKDYGAAVILLKNALQADPRDISARVELANTYLKQEDGLSAEKELLRARRDGAQENFIIAPLGRAYLLQGKYDQVLQKITTAGTTPEVKAKVLRVRGLAYLAERRFADAEDAFNQSVAIAPNSDEPYVGLARISIARNMLDEAGGYLKKAIAYNPASAEAWFVKGEIARLQNDKQAALKSYDTALRFAPDFERALMARARILIDEGRPDEAEPDVLKVRSQQKRNPEAAYLYALILTARNDLKGAREALDEADQDLKAIGAETIRFNPPLLLLQGVVSYFRKDFETAYQQLSEYHREVPQHLGARKLLAALEMSRGHPLQAIDLLEPVAKATPNDFEVLLMLGDALMRAGRKAESTKVLERAAHLAPGNDNAISQLAMLRLLAGQEDAAVANLEKALKLDPKATDLATLLSLAQLQRGRNEAAIKTARLVVERDPKNPVPYNLIAGAYLKMKRFGEARKYFEASIAADPTYRPALSNLAKLEFAQGNFDRAYSLYEKLLAMNPVNGQVMMSLADVEQQRGHPEEAIRWLVKARATTRDRRLASLKLVGAYIAADKPELAIRTAENLQAQDPGNIVFLAALGRAYLDGKRLSRAAKTFADLSQRAIEAKAPIWVFRAGEWQEQARDIEGARESFRQAIILAPNYLAPRLALFRHDMISRNFKSAEERVAAVRKIAPDPTVADALMGDIYMAQGKFALASTEYDKVMAKHPAAAPKIALRAYRAKRAARDPNAVAFVERWVEARHDDPAARRMLANVYADTGHPKSAIDIYERLLDAKPDDAALLNNLSMLYIGRDDAKALALAKRAAEAAPGSAAIMDTYGWLLVKQGKVAEGFDMLRNARLRAPEVPEIRYHLAVALNALGRKKDALAEVSAALRASQHFEGADDARSLMEKLSTP